VKYLACYAQAHGDGETACQWFLERWPHAFGKEHVKREQKDLALSTKAASPPGSTTDPSWASPLVGVSVLADGFLALARSASLLGRIPGLRRIPFNVRIPTEDQSASYAWVTQGGGKPVSSMAFGQGVTLERLKAAGINVFTAELIKAMSDATEAALRDALIGGLTMFQDTSFLSTDAAIAATRPAGILNGLTPVAPGADFAASIAALLDAFFAARPAAQAVSLIASPRKAAQLRTLNGGAGPGYDVITTAAAGTKVIVLDASAVFVADGGIEVDVSSHAAFQMDDAPDSPPTATTVVRSLWQDNLVGLKVERFLSWWPAPTAVQYLA
jgi:hypothetical protein